MIRLLDITTYVISSSINLPFVLTLDFTQLNNKRNKVNSQNHSNRRQFSNKGKHKIVVGVNVCVCAQVHVAAQHPRQRREGLRLPRHLPDDPGEPGRRGAGLHVLLRRRS